MPLPLLRQKKKKGHTSSHIVLRLIRSYVNISKNNYAYIFSVQCSSLMQFSIDLESKNMGATKINVRWMHVTFLKKQQQQNFCKPTSVHSNELFFFFKHI